MHSGTEELTTGIQGPTEHTVSQTLADTPLIIIFLGPLLLLEGYNDVLDTLESAVVQNQYSVVP